MREKIENWLKDNIGTYSFLCLLVGIVFVVPLFGRSFQEIMYKVLITLIYFGVVLHAPKYWRTLLWVAVFSTLISWISYYTRLEILHYFTEGINLILFGYGVILLLNEIASTKKVDTGVIFDAINGYLLLGLFFTIVIGLVHQYNPASISFPEQADYNLSDYNYFSFISFSTLGYGDITPHTSATRSLAMLTCVSGQLYLTIIVALLVGKYSN